MQEDFDRAYWEERYRTRGPDRHAHVNPVLMDETADLVPGSALEVGCGEGAGAIWLATHGWRVTAADIASTALDRGRERAEHAGADVARQIEWVHADLTSRPLDRDRFDLVCSFYVHTTETLERQIGRLASATSPGGTLLIVGHGPSDPRHARPDASVTAEQIAGVLGPSGWDVIVAETRTRSANRHDGEITLHDAVLRARKRV